MATPQYKLTYFDLKGLGECVRYIFAYKKIKFEDEHIKYFTLEDRTKTRWAEMKESVPFGQVPLLEVNGKPLTQSLAICQYLAGQYDLLSGDAWEDALLTSYGGTILDYLLRVAKYYYEEEPKAKAELKKEVETVTVPYYLSRFESILIRKGDYFGGKLTWMDFYIVAGFETIHGMLDKDWLSGYPALEKHSQRIWNLPGIKEHIAERPPYTR